jgi:hypothetical protein
VVVRAGVSKMAVWFDVEGLIEVELLEIMVVVCEEDVAGGMVVDVDAGVAVVGAVGFIFTAECAFEAADDACEVDNSLLELGAFTSWATGVAAGFELVPELVIVMAQLVNFELKHKSCGIYSYIEAETNHLGLDFTFHTRNTMEDAKRWTHALILAPWTMVAYDQPNPTCIPRWCSPTTSCRTHWVHRTLAISTIQTEATAGQLGAEHYPKMRQIPAEHQATKSSEPL